MLCTDIAVIANSNLRLPVKLPVPAKLAYYYQMFRVFVAWGTLNSTFTARVAHEPPLAGDRWEWAEHNIQDLFTMPLAESHARISLRLTADCHGVAEQLASLYQRRTDAKVGGVLISAKIWPKSPEGYLARFAEAETKGMCAYWAP